MAFIAEFPLPMSYYLVMKKYEEISELLQQSQHVKGHAYRASVLLLLMFVSLDVTVALSKRLTWDVSGW